MSGCLWGARVALGLVRLPVCPRRATARLRLTCPAGHVQRIAACEEHATDAHEFGALCRRCRPLTTCDVETVGHLTP